MDGNNSAKRLKGAGSADCRQFESDYFLTREAVNKFQNEVKQRTRKPKEYGAKKAANVDTNDRDDDVDNTAAEDAPWITVDEPGEAADGEEKFTSCTKNWKASADESSKKSLAVYESTGIFPSACRHGFILKVAEMVESGEL